MMITDKDGQMKNVASAGVGNTALGLSIGALGLELLRGNGLAGLGNLLGCAGNGGAMTAAGLASVAPGLMENFYTAHEVQTLRDLYDLKGYVDQSIITSNNREAERFHALDKQTDKNFFDMYVNYNNKFAEQKSEIDSLKTNFAVLDAVLPYVIREATCDCVKASKFVRSSDIAYNANNGPCSNGGWIFGNGCGCNSGFYSNFPPVVTPTTTSTT